MTDDFNISCSSIDTQLLDQFDEKLQNNNVSHREKTSATDDISAELRKHQSTAIAELVQTKTAISSFTDRISRSNKRRNLGCRPSNPTLSSFMDTVNKTATSKRDFQNPLKNNQTDVDTCKLDVNAVEPPQNPQHFKTPSGKSKVVKCADIPGKPSETPDHVTHTTESRPTVQTDKITHNPRISTSIAQNRSTSTSIEQNPSTSKTTGSIRLNTPGTTIPDNSKVVEPGTSKHPNNTTKQHATVQNTADTANNTADTASNTADTAKNTAEFTREMCELRRWGLPPEVLARYHDLKITHMFPWQAQCLSLEGVLGGKNLVYCAPTSAGKTLVAELLLVKRVLETKQKVLFVLPFVSVAHEKTAYLKGILEETDVKVGGFFGTKAPPGGLSKVHVAVCTIEKANNIVNRLMEDKTMDQLGCVVVDEVHMVGDKSRGYLLELLLTKILFHCKYAESRVQVIGMSATLPNLPLLSSWLEAALYTTDYRPVPLTQHVKIGCVLYDVKGNPVRQLPAQSQEHLIYLCQETLKDGHNVLIFCSTKAWTEKLADLISRSVVSDKQALDETLQLDVPGLADIHTQLARLPMSVDPTLAKTISCGVAFHHAGLTVDEREIIERGFRGCIIRVLIATSTLSAGVNLPARRVIIRSPKFGPGFLSPLVYQQMSGRAGRKGVDEAGESILICTPAERSAIPRVVSSMVDPVSSCLGGERLGVAMKRAMLEIIASGLVATQQQISDYFRCTLVSVEKENGDVALKEAIDFLLNYEFIESSEDTDGSAVYKATKLGLGTLNSALPPDEALELLSHLQKARRNFNLESELQLVYEVTPLSISYSWPNPAWFEFFKLWERYPASYRRAGENVGVSEGYLARASSGFIYQRTDEQRLLYQTHLRFFAASALLDAINEVPLDTVAKKYHTNRGLLQTLQSAASSYAGQVAVFSERLGFNTLSLLLSDLQTRLFSGVTRELCDLVRVDLLSGPLARQLYNAGYTGVASLSNAQPTDVRDILQNILPFKSEKEGGGRAGRSWLDKRHGLTELEAAHHIIHNAKEILKEDLSQMNVQIDLADIVKPNKTTKNRLLTTLTNSSRRSSNSLYNTRPSTTAKPSISPTHQSNTSVLTMPANLTPGKSNLTPRLRDVTPSKLHLTPHRSAVPENILNVTPTPAVLNSSFGADKPTVSAAPRVVQLRASECTPLSSSFDEFNLSAWDFVDVDEDLLGRVEMKENTVSPKRAISSPKKSPVKKLKLGSPQISPVKKTKLSSPKKSPLIFINPPIGQERPNNEKQVMRNLNEVFDQATNSEGKVLPERPDSYTLESVGSITPLRGPAALNLILQPDKDPISLQKSANSPLKKLASQTKCMASPAKSGNVATQGYSIIDVTGDYNLFHVFLDEWRSHKKYSIALAWDNIKAQEQCSANQSLSFAENVSSDFSSVGNTDIVGIAVCWGEMDAYYLNLKESTEEQRDDGSTPAVHKGVSKNMRLQYLRDILQDTDEVQRIGFDMKTQWKLLATSCNISIEEDILDCKVAAWLLDPDAKERTFISLLSRYIPGIVGTCGLSGNNPHIPGTSRLRSCLDALLAWHLHSALRAELEARSLDVPYLEVEAPCTRTLARMEINGFGFSVEECKSQQALLVTHMGQLETIAYKLAGQAFSLASPAEISEILYQKLHLPPNGDPDKPVVRKRGRRPTYSTARDVLEKLSALHPLPSAILEWRRVSHALSKTLGSIPVSVVECSALNMARLHPVSQQHTSTGRVSFHEPNVQNINREFKLDFPDKIKALDASFVPQTATLRSMFVPYRGAVLVAADYSQLELRIMAHLSGDRNLRQQLNGGGDVFSAIAAQWKGCPTTEITPAYRQQAKQICYGILYGMGSKSLGETLNVSEGDAGMFMDSFKDKYPGLKTYIRNTISFCREKGYVRTILGRRRYLPHIASDNTFARAQAERQCVNTTIQGSAADLVKVAMINIDRRLQEEFPHTKTCHTQLNVPTVPKGAFLVLQLHDELIYEVYSPVLMTVTRMIKEEMENALKLKVVLPVKLKRGPSWGDLADFEIE